jgi:hypothetical protein
MIHRLGKVDLEGLGETLERLNWGDLEARQSLKLLKERLLLRLVFFGRARGGEEAGQDKSGQGPD